MLGIIFGAFACFMIWYLHHVFGSGRLNSVWEIPGIPDSSVRNDTLSPIRSDSDSSSNNHGNSTLETQQRGDESQSSDNNEESGSLNSESESRSRSDISSESGTANGTLNVTSGRT